MIVRLSEVTALLNSLLGPELTEASGLPREAAAILRGWTPGTEALPELARRLEDCALSCLYPVLGKAMVFRAPDGQMVRIRTENLAELADALLGVLFASMSPQPAYYNLLKDYAMQHGSLSALTALCRDYADSQPPEETALMRRILMDRYGNHPLPDFLREPASAAKPRSRE